MESKSSPLLYHNNNDNNDNDNDNDNNNRQLVEQVTQMLQGALQNLKNTNTTT